MDSLVHDCVQVGAEPRGIDAGRPTRRCGYQRAGHEPAGGNRSKLGDRDTVSRAHERLSCLHLAKDRAGVVPQLSLSDLPSHHYECSTCSRL